MKKKSSTKKPKPTLVTFLLDRTGSMAVCKAEAIGGFNGYVDGIKEAKDMKFTFVQFDSISRDALHRAVPVSKVTRLTDKSFEPRGNTPLYDAMAATIKETQEDAKGCKVLFVTLTDGEENSSIEWDLQKIQALMKEREDKDKWTFVHIGVGMAGWQEMRKVSAGTIGASNVLRTDAKNIKRSIQRSAVHTVSYAANMDADGSVVSDFYCGLNDDTNSFADAAKAVGKMKLKK